MINKFDGHKPRFRNSISKTKQFKPQKKTNTDNPFKKDFMQGFDPFGKDGTNISEPYKPPISHKYGIRPDPGINPMPVYGFITPGPGGGGEPPAHKYGIKPDPTPQPQPVYGITPGGGGGDIPALRYGIKPSPEPPKMYVLYGFIPRG